MPMPNRMSIAGLPNTLAADVVTITAGNEGASMQAANLKDWHSPSQMARLIGFETAAGNIIMAPHLSYWDIDYGSAPAQLIRQLGLGYYTLVPGDQIRGIGVSSGNLPAVRSAEVVPTNILASNNLNSTDVTRIDEILTSVDVSTISTAAQGDAFMLLEYGSPASAPAVGSQYQCFAIVVRVGHTSAGPEDFGRVTASLYEDGVLVRNMGTKLVKETSLLLFPWDAAELADPLGTDVQLRIDFYDPDVSGGSIRIDCAPWQVLYQSAVDACDADTGWMTVAGGEIEADFGNTSVDEVDDLPPITRHFLDEPVDLAKARIEIRGDGLGYHQGFLHGEPREHATFIDAGFAIAHPTFQFDFQFDDNGELEWVDTYVGEDEVTLDGGDNKVLLHRRRECKVNFGFVPKSKAEALFKRLKGDQPLLVSLFPGNGVESGDLYTFLATANRIDPHRMRNYTRDNELTREIGYSLIEKLG